ncbi:MAG TPA: KpsF/GutQ family sugar-phosphate isomerase [Burkholderiales bacterium]
MKAAASSRRRRRPNAIERAREVLLIEAQAITALHEGLAQPARQADFLRAVELIRACQDGPAPAGRVVVSGVGKSGHVARKIASTLASTGTPALFVHAAEAAHGDLGMVTEHDVLIAISYSGESAELLTIVPALKRVGAKLIAITGNPASSLAAESDVHLDAGVEREACPLDLAPTASTTASLALGDALAMALLEERGFTAEDFARTHPGGSLGRRLLTHVRDVMRTGAQIPSVPDTATLADAILEISRKGLGMTAILDPAGRLAGIYTDGDLRRTLEKSMDLKSLKVAEVMTRNPRTIGPDRLAVEAVKLMDECSINQLLVTDTRRRVLGALNMHDLMKAGVL